jgi:hypothetical protein
MMHEPEKSDSAIVARKPANKARQPVAEPVERKGGLVVIPIVGRFRGVL